MAGSDYLQGVRIDEDGSAMFKIKILALSSQHQHQEFRFEVVVEGSSPECIKSVPFRTLSKVHRKRKLSNEHVEADLLETLANVFDDPSFLTDDMFQSIRITHEAIVEKTKQVTELQTDITELNANLGKLLSQISIMRYTPPASTSSDFDAEGWHSGEGSTSGDVSDSPTQVNSNEGE